MPAFGGCTLSPTGPTAGTCAPATRHNVRTRNAVMREEESLRRNAAENDERIVGTGGAFLQNLCNGQTRRLAEQANVLDCGLPNASSVGGKWRMMILSESIRSPWS